MRSLLLNRRQALLALAAAAHTPLALAAWPERPVTIIVSFPAGGVADVHMRKIAQVAEKRLGQPIVIENRPGALGLLGANAMATAKPDGYTLLQATQNVFRAPALGKVQFDPLEFTYIMGFADGYTGLFVPASSPWKNLRELAEASRAKPEGISCGTTGLGSSGHLILADLQQKAQAKLTHIPYKGAPEMGVAIVGGHLDAAFLPLAVGLQLGDKAKALGIFTEQRSAQLPNVRTAREQGFDIVSSGSFGLVGPKGMPPQIVNALREAFEFALNDPSHDELLRQIGMVPWRKGPSEYTAWAIQTVVAERRMVEAAGLLLK
ncbi:tripartite tricarboxylate transporter substrate binding protein [Variovorax paradoxus]|nr:tripartite tricarboxylate transporter substrate binding protein [Variovorax paradoxus]MBT2304816.1 tripartite tricarboxylate transporter substrate binding protein [Variovorax paradoxus]